MRRDSERVLLTGGAGFIGSHLARRLVQEGFRVRILDDFSVGRAENISGIAAQVEVVRGSILNSKLLVEAADGCGCIFHLAAIVSVPRSIDEPEYVHEVNATGTFAVLEAARKQGSRVVFSSSAAVYGQISCAAQCEDEPLSPISPYGVQKLLGELYLRSYHHVHSVESFALRYFNVYGPGQDPSSPYSGVISIFRERARMGEDLIIFGNGTQTRDYVHVDDVVEANLAAMRASQADGSGINVGTGRPTDLNMLARMLVGLSGNGSSIEYGPVRNGDIAHSCAQTDLAQHRLGFQAKVDIRRGLESLVGSAG